jgi:hypothetical protein
MLGRLSLLTPEVVSAAAASDIKTGRRVGLNWNMKKLEYSQFSRQSCSHKVIPVGVLELFFPLPDVPEFASYL